LANDWNQVSSIFLGVITAFATVALAYYANKSFKGVKDQMDLMFKQSVDMKRQADAMEVQSSFIKSQSDAMIRQADIMDGQTNFVRDQSIAMQNQASTMLDQAEAMKCQSKAMVLQSNIMIEKMNYEWLVKNYERVSKEMTLFIGPLYSRRKDHNIFSLSRPSQRVVPGGAWQSGTDLTFDFVSFWDSIDQNLYLNRSDDLKEAFLNYSKTIEEYFGLSKQAGKNQEQSDMAKKFNNDIKPKLIKSIEKRYDEVSDELKKMEFGI